MLIVLTMLTVIGMTVVLPVLPFVVLQYVSHESDLAIWVGVLEAVNGLCAFLVAPSSAGSPTASVVDPSSSSPRSAPHSRWRCSASAVRSGSSCSRA